MEGQGQLTPEAQKREDEWLNTHGDCEQGGTGNPAGEAR